MNAHVASLCQKYATKGVFVDANLLLLWFVGSLGKPMVSSCKRTREFTPEDFDILVGLLSKFSKYVTTPNVLTEVSNLAGNFGRHGLEFAKVFSKAVQAMDEEYVKSSDTVKMDEFAKFGLSDSTIMRLVKGKYLLLTAELPLARFFEFSGRDVINFNHVRTSNWS